MQLNFDAKRMLSSTNIPFPSPSPSPNSSFSTDSSWESSQVSTPAPSHETSFYNNIDSGHMMMNLNFNQFVDNSQNFNMALSHPMIPLYENNLAPVTDFGGSSPYHPHMASNFSCSDGLPSSRMMETENFMEYSPFVVPSQTVVTKFEMHSPSHQPETTNLEDFESPASACHSDDLFSQYSPFSSSSPCSSSMSPSPRKLSTRPVKQEVANASAALQKVQINGLERRAAMRQRKERDYLPSWVERTGQGKQVCLVKGCGKRFQRGEHLKRHWKTHDNNPNDKIRCPFCTERRPKEFHKARQDNFKDHIRRHLIQKEKPARTNFNMRAFPTYLNMCLKAGKRSKKSKSDSQNEAIDLAAFQTLYEEQRRLGFPDQYDSGLLDPGMAFFGCLDSKL